MDQGERDRNGFDRGTLVALLVVGVVLAGGVVVQQTPAGKRIEQWGQRHPEQPLRMVKGNAGGGGTAPALRRGATRKVGSRLMASWIASGAGDSSYNGTFSESGTHNGQPTYTNGSRWLWYDGTSHGPDLWRWVLSDAVASATAAYLSETDTLPGGDWWTDSGSSPAPEFVLGSWVRFGTSEADAALWDDATKHRFSKHGDAGGGYKNVDSGVSGVCPSSFGVEYSAPTLASKYKIALRCAGYVWHTATDLDGGEGTLSASLACKLPWGSDVSWRSRMGEAGAKTITIELRKQSDDTLVASDTAAFTMFIPALSITSPAENAATGSPVTLELTLDEWYAPADPEAEITQEGGGTGSGGTVTWELPTLTASDAIPLDVSNLIDGSEFTLTAEVDAGGQVISDTIDLIYDEAYAIQIDSPQTGAVVPRSFGVSGQCTGAIKGEVALYRGIDLLFAYWRGPAAAVWSGNIGYGEGEQWGGGIQAKQEFGGVVLATSGWVFVTAIDDGTPTPPGPPTPGEPTVRIDLPAAGATVGSNFTALISYAGYSTGLGTLEIMLIGASGSWELLSASRGVTGSGQYAELLEMPEGLDDGSYTLLARLTLGSETDDDSHLISYDAEGVLSDPPTCEILAPLDAASVSGLVNVDVEATDDAGVWAVALYVDGMLQETLSAPNYGSLYRFQWDSRTWANGSHVLEARAVDVDLQVANDSITVNLVNSMADTTLIRFTPQLGAGIAIGNFSDRDYTRSIEDLQVPEPATSNPALQYVLQVGYNKPGTSRSWADYRVVQPGRSHSLVPATGNRIAWAICATPRQTAASWAAGGAAAIRLAASPSAVYALETTPHAIRRIGLTSGADSVWQDLSSLASAPVDMVYWDNRLVVAHSDRILLLPEDGSLGMEIGMPWPDVVASVDRLAVVGDDLVIAATLAAGGSRLYRYGGEAPIAVCDHDYAITALRLCGSLLVAGNANGDILQLAAVGNALQLAYASGQASVPALGINGSTIYAGTGDAGKIYRRVVGWNQSADMGWTRCQALAAFNGWIYAGGNGTGGQYLWYEATPGSWVQAMELTGATAVNDLLAVSGSGSEQLFAAVSGASSGAIWRIEMATVDGIICDREWIDHPTYEFGVLA